MSGREAAPGGSGRLSAGREIVVLGGVAWNPGARGRILRLSVMDYGPPGDHLYEVGFDFGASQLLLGSELREAEAAPPTEEELIMGPAP